MRHAGDGGGWGCESLSLANGRTGPDEKDDETTRLLVHGRSVGLGLEGAGLVGFWAGAFCLIGAWDAGRQ